MIFAIQKRDNQLTVGKDFSQIKTRGDIAHILLELEQFKSELLQRLRTQ